MTQDLYTYRFGVNYTPSKDWWYCWNSFDVDSIARDLDAIAALEADHLRIMAMWTYFQPDPVWVSPTHLERLDTLLRLAGERNLDVCIAMLNGHLTGQGFRQGYERGRNMYTDPLLRNAQKLYFDAVGAVAVRHENFLGFDLGNEMNCCWRSESLDEGDAWMRDMLAHAQAVAPDRTHVNGVDHGPWFFPTTFSPVALATMQPIVALHCWVYFTEALKRSEPLGPQAAHLIDGMAALARSHAGQPAKPVWVQEYGASETWMPPETIPSFLETATRNALDGGVTWFTWWASHDIDPKFKVHELEYSLGLLTVDQRLKPQGEVYRDIARSYRGKRLDPATLADAPLPPPPAEHTHGGVWDWLERWIETRG